MIENSGSMESIKANVETSVCKESAETVPMVIDWNQLPRPREQQSQLNDTLIHSFLGLVGAGVTREKAIALLKVWNWDVSLAVNDFFDHPSHGVFLDEETLVAIEMNWQENRGNLEAEIGNSFSSLNATKITFQVLLADSRNGAEVFMTFRSDQTLRDIRNRIAEFRPDDNTDYYLTSVDGGDIYEDLDTTVQRIHCRGATKLLQVFSDS